MSGKPVTTGKSVAVGAVVGVAVGVSIDDVVVGVAVGPSVVGVAVGVSVGGAVVGVLVEVAVAVGAAAQIGPKMLLASNVTAACARARPFKLAPVCRLILVPARMLPMTEELAKRSAAETSLHHTLHGSPPVTDEPADAVSVAADLKIQTPDPLSVRFPVNRKASAQ